MPIKRLTVLAVFAAAFLASAPASATTAHPANASFTAIAPVTSVVSADSPLASLSAWAVLPSLAGVPAATHGVAASAAATTAQAQDTAADDSVTTVTDLRKSLIGLAMDLRDTRYVRGGRDPATGFDCSGFVRYVFAHAIGMKLPTTSASQFLAGLKVKRADMKPGDLVFFKTGSKRHISHVGIYISNGRFIHSPATGKTVQVSSLDDSYWASHFAGAKRPSGIAAVASNG
ncbi:MAG: C40 family peptidase [Rhodanobacter sp.]